MKPRYRVLLGGIALSAVAALFFLNSLSGSLTTDRAALEETPSRPTIKAAIGVKDDPNAREEFELLRLADPATGAVPPDIRRLELEYARTLPQHTAKTSALAWVRRGPHNVGGRTRAFGIDVRDPSIMLAGGVNGSIWRSTDGGATWTDTFADTDLHSVTSIVQDTRAGAEDTWYAGTGEVRGASGWAPLASALFFGNGLYKSTDNGLSWSALPSTQTTVSNAFFWWWQFVWEVATDPSAGTSEVYAANAGGLDRSTDSGTTFSSVLFGSSVSTACRTDVAVSPTGVVYSSLSSSCGVPGGDTGIYSSTTGALGSFTDLAYPGGPVFARAEIAVSPVDEDYVWVLAQLASSTALHLYNPSLVTCPGIGGAPTAGWCDYSAFLPARLGGAGTGTFDTQSSYNIYIEPHPTDLDILLVGGTSLYRIDITGTAGTPGSGDTWIGGYEATGSSFARYVGDLPGSDDHHPDLHSGSFLPPPYGAGVGENDPDVFISGSDGGVHRTDDVLSAGDGTVDWTSLNNGYHTTQFYTVCMNSDSSDPVIGGGLQDNGTWTTTSAVTTDPWVEELTGDGAYCAVANNTTSGTSRYASAQGGLVYRLIYNAGGVFTGFTRVDPTGGSGYLFINPFILDPADETNRYVGAGSTVWRNSNLEGIGLGSNSTTSTNWTNLTPPGVSGQVSALAMSTTGSRLYFGTSAGGVFRIDGADTYTPASAITSISSGLPSAFVSSISVDPSDADRVMITYSNYNTVGVWFSTDGGTSWTNVEGNLLGAINGSGDTGPSFRGSALLPEASPTSYFVATSTGLYSTDALAGASTVWTQEGPTVIDNTIVDMVRVRPSDGTIIAGTHGHGLFSADASLPVELGAVTALVDGRDIRVAWETQSELNNTGFEVQYRLASEVEFESAGFVPGAGTSVTRLPYEFTIADVLPASYVVRLKQVDVSGASTYSPLVEVSVETDDPIVVTEAFPNPANDHAEFSVVVREEGIIRISLFDVAGRRVSVLHNGPIASNTPQRFVVNARELASGTYFVRVEGRGISESRQFVVVK